ncbi:hypothetical protein ACLOJK_034699 [Asimina triloba]
MADGGEICKRETREREREGRERDLEERDEGKREGQTGRWREGREREREGRVRDLEERDEGERETEIGRGGRGEGASDGRREIEVTTARWTSKMRQGGRWSYNRGEGDYLSDGEGQRAPERSRKRRRRWRPEPKGRSSRTGWETNQKGESMTEDQTEPKALRLSRCVASLGLPSAEMRYGGRDVSASFEFELPPIRVKSDDSE